ncbi:2-aminoethanethiol dioxygenase-like [Stegodyphus dumicola]|uniref:2-aminoethanethiol dioxygenase-like n=1 Tax=Stegodyphus dumicola TaxID=202533 RepID=UPI0015AFD32D|nr:2-aminoethanethiol dioxygenase-like [Stegodyphus dumicola]
MSSLVEAIARQAQSTFSKTLTDESFSEKFSKLIRYVSRVRASDLRISRDVMRTVNRDNTNPVAPVTYIEVTENNTFSMGIFMLRNGTKIPLHDHPGMHGVLKVVLGTVKITSYSPVSKVPVDSKLPQDIENEIPPSERKSLIPVEKSMSANVSDKDEPCVLRPREGNYHEICAVGGVAAFLDILAPPYEATNRDCHYYTAFETSSTDSEVKVWLKRRGAPSDFWCEAAPYNGPRVYL